MLLEDNNSIFDNKAAVMQRDEAGLRVRTFIQVTGSQYKSDMKNERPGNGRRSSWEALWEAGKSPGFVVKVMVCHR